MKRLVMLACVLGMVNIALAEIITIQGIGIDFVSIRNPGDTRTEINEYGRLLANPYGCGAVDYEYRIGRYEITANQWQTINTSAEIDNQ